MALTVIRVNRDGVRVIVSAFVVACGDGQDGRIFQASTAGGCEEAVVIVVRVA
jgi:hypothetical protein